MNEKKFCFIICSNNHFLAEECQRYIHALEIPSGYEIQIIVVYDAESMTSGYNRAMKQSDAKYKIYLHQDVLLLNKKMLFEILDIFQANSYIGMLGMVGNPTLAEDGCPWSGDTECRIGEIYADLISDKVYSLFQKANGKVQKVLTIDGLLMITQYDLPWREDLFLGWDFYDGSQSLEFWKAGYSVVVPYMSMPWCLHDNDILHLQDYEKWRMLFEKEYRRYYQNRCANLLEDGVKLEKQKAVIYQIFHPELTRYSFPYPPVYKEPDADYICFTDDINLKSDIWKIEYRPELSADAIRQEMSNYPIVKELKTNEIQVGSVLSTGEKIDAIMQIPALSELPGIEFDLNKFVPTRDEEGNYIYQKNPVYTNGKYDGREFVLTIGMPVSNQIDTIDRCLSHIKPLLEELDSELVIVDTGSTDGTIEVCKKYGARIVEFPWCNNMSAARNQGIYHAKGEWYMSIDADEWFEDVSEILCFFKSKDYKNYDYAAYIQRNYTYQKELVYADAFAFRMAKITPELHFEGRIHDALQAIGGNRGYQFHSFTHHYGFAVDDEKKRKEKYKRNVSNLVYDVWEAPENLVNNYQLCQEFLAIGYYGLAYRYGFLGLSVEQQIPSSYYGRLHAARLISAFYYAEDEGIFEVLPLLENRYPFTEAERAYFSYILADLGIRFSHDENEILNNLKDYWKYQKAYERNEAENQRLTYVGLDYSTNIQYQTDAQVMALFAYSNMGDIKDALEVIDNIQEECIWYKKYLYFEQLLFGEDEVYQKMVEKISVSQFELWLFDIMQNFQNGKCNIQNFAKAFQRFSDLLSRFCVESIQQYMNKFGFHMESNLEQIIWDTIINTKVEDCSIQQLCFYCFIVKNRILSLRDEQDYIDIFKIYVAFQAAFIEKYYHPDLLSGMNNTAISPEKKALYEIQKASTARSIAEAAKHLKNALKIFPGFKKEIQILLNDLQQKEKKQRAAQSEMELLKQQLMEQVENLMQQGKTQEAEQILQELEKIFQQGE